MVGGHPLGEEVGMGNPGAWSGESAAEAATPAAIACADAAQKPAGLSPAPCPCQPHGAGTAASLWPLVPRIRAWVLACCLPHPFHMVTVSMSGCDAGTLPPR